MKKLKAFFELLSNTSLFWVYLVTGIVYSLISISAPSISGALVNSVIYNQEDLQRNLMLLVAIYALQMIFSVSDQYCSNLFVVNQKKRMRNRVFGAYIKESGRTREEISSFVSFINNDIPDIVENYFQGNIDIIKCFCITVGSSIALISIHWLLAVVIVGCSILIIVLPNIMKEQAARRREKYANALGKYNTVLESLLNGADIIKAYLYEKTAERRLADENGRVEKEEQSVRKCQLCVFGMTGFVQIAKQVLILTIGVYLIYIQDIKVGELLAAVQLAEIMAAPIEVMAYLLNGRNEVKPLIEKYKEIIETTDASGTTELGKIENVQIKNLMYCAGGVRILNHISFSLKAGKNYLLVGKSGSGKTTLLKLIARLCKDDYRGELYINNTDYRDIVKHSFYKKVGVVPQEPYLFWMSLEENILLGRSIKREEYIRIIEKLNLSYLLDRFENQTLNEDMVSRLSGGEKQRISLARAMVSKPEIYLLDEVTSSLDEKNAYEIEKILLEEEAMVVHACHKIIPELKEKYDEIICLD